MTQAILDSSGVQRDDAEIVEEADEVVPYTYSISSYGADYPVDGLVKRLRDGSIFVPPFQRDYVWGQKQASRFVESLLLGLPVPGIFLSKEADTQKLLIIDGQQRLHSLLFFYDGIFEPSSKEFALSGIASAFEGRTYKTLGEDDRRRLDDSILHATVIRQDEPSEDQSSIYFIFERLNTGGVRLQPQQIRATLYHGPFQQVLKSLNEAEAWRRIYGAPSRQLRDQELILRFLAMLFMSAQYKRPMKEFLNKYMGRNRLLGFQTADQVNTAFIGSVTTILKCVGERAFRPKRALNAAVYDSVMVGTARRLSRGEIVDSEAFGKAYDALLLNEAYQSLTERATADEESVSKRLQLATNAFANLK